MDTNIIPNIVPDKRNEKRLPEMSKETNKKDEKFASFRERLLTTRIAAVTARAERYQKNSDRTIARLEAQAEKIRLGAKMSRAEANELIARKNNSDKAELERIEGELTPKLRNQDSPPEKDEKTITGEHTEKKRKARRGKKLYDQFCSTPVVSIEDALAAADTPSEKAFYRQMLNLKLRTEQEKVIGEVLY